MKTVVDGFEGPKARLEEIGTRKTLVVDRADLPRGAVEGSVVDDASGAWELDCAETARRRSKAAALLAKVLGRGAAR